MTAGTDNMATPIDEKPFDDENIVDPFDRVALFVDKLDERYERLFVRYESLNHKYQQQLFVYEVMAKSINSNSLRFIIFSVLYCIFAAIMSYKYFKIAF